MKPKSIHISKEKLEQILDYDPISGIFRWKIKRGRFAKPGLVAGTKRRYVSISINCLSYQAHRLAWYLCFDEEPEIVDHINGNKLDNRISNLRAANKSLNAQNVKTHLDNKCGLKGVSFYKPVNKYRATIYHNKKQILLGYFNCMYAAHEAYIEKAQELFGNFARN